LSLVGIGRTTAPVQPPEVMVGEPTPPITVIAPGGDTIKLGTFEPLPPAKDCTEMYFRVVD